MMFKSTHKKSQLPLPGVSFCIHQQGRHWKGCMLSYLRTKPIPAQIPQEFLSEADLMSICELTPEETHCHLCPSHPPLNAPLLITGSGTLVTLQGVRRGTCITD